jgi:hypothetical protein
MKAAVKKITEQSKVLPARWVGAFLSWPEEYEMGHQDAWDKEIERDPQNGGSLSSVLKRVREDIASGKTKPLDEILDNS